MFWLIATILSHFFFSLASLGDKIVLAGPSKPKKYTFLVGMFSILVVLLIPFVGFTFPDTASFWWIILEALVYVAGLYAMFVALEHFDVSRVIPMIGATQPIFIFILTMVFFGAQALKLNEFIAFGILILGSFLISIDKNPKVTKDSLTISILTSLMFSLDYVFSKFVFNGMSFEHGFVWMRMFSFLFVFVLFFDKGFRDEMFKEKDAINNKTGLIFVVSQCCGGLANILQSWAISLAPIAYLAIMNATKGIQYVFLFVMTLFVAVFWPKVLHESHSKRVLLQKVVSIILIGLGLAVLVMG